MFSGLSYSFYVGRTQPCACAVVYFNEVPHGRGGVVGSGNGVYDFHSGAFVDWHNAVVAGGCRTWHRTELSHRHHHHCRLVGAGMGGAVAGQHQSVDENEYQHHTSEEACFAQGNAGCEYIQRHGAE